MDFTKNEDRSVTVTGTKDSFTSFRDTLAEGWGEDDSLVEEFTNVLSAESASTLTITIEPDAVGEVIDVLEAADDDELRELGDGIAAMIEEHNRKALEEAEREA